MATPNPFAPFASTRPMGAPQLRPMPVPNSNFQKQPSLMTKLAPTAFGLAMESDEAGQAKDYLMGQGKDAFATLTGTAPALGSSAAFSAPAIMGGAEGAIAAQAAKAAATGANIIGGAEGAIAAQTAAAAAQAATSKAAATALMGAAPATAASGMVAAAGPMAALGPMGVPLLIGATLMSGK